MKKVQLFLGVLVVGATSCSTLFWQPTESIPSAKVVPTDRLNVQLFDAHGMRSSGTKVELVARQMGDSTYVQQMIVPKFSEVYWEPKPTNYLWIASTADTSVYRLTYRALKPVAIPSTVGAATMLLGLSTVSEDYGATFAVGTLIYITGGIADALSWRWYQYQLRREAPIGIRRNLRLIDVAPVSVSDLNAPVRRGISAYSDSLRTENAPIP
ncbi:MAG: hypothetical protein ACKOW0_03345 [Schleiferiaceae bacterium]